MRNVYGVMAYVEVEADDARHAEQIVTDILVVYDDDGVAVLASHAVSSRQEDDGDES